jgi:hypothetical protein
MDTVGGLQALAQQADCHLGECQGIARVNAAFWKGGGVGILAVDR